MHTNSKVQIIISCVDLGGGVGKGTTCAAYQTGSYLHVSPQSDMCLALGWGVTGTRCRRDGVRGARGEERAMTVANPSPWHRPAVQLTAPGV